MKRDNAMLVAAAVLALIGGAFFRQDEPYKLTAVRLLVITVLIVACNVFLFVRRAEWEYRRNVLRYSGMGLFTMGLMQGICRIRQMENMEDTLRTGLGTAVAVILLGAFLLLLRAEKGVTENVIMTVIFAGFLVRIFYAMMTDGLLFQNDITAFHVDCQGHLGYICHLYTNGRLPDVNPMTAFEFCQPPLYYAVSAVFLRVYGLLGLLPEIIWGVDETLQILPMMYSMMTLVFIDKIGKQIKLSTEGRLTAVCFAGFLPYSVMMSGALNNDTLATLLMVMSIYYTLRWYEKPDVKGIVIMAVCIGAAMMTKLSAVVIVPAMAVMMLYRVWKDREKWAVYLKQFICFGVVALPLGLWYPVYCRIRYQMPFGYVVSFDDDALQFIGMYDKWSRLFRFENAFEFLTIRDDQINGFADYNIPVSLVKYATFGDSHYYLESRLTQVTGTCIFWVNIVLFILMPLLFAVWCFCRDGRRMQKIFMLTVAAASLYFYVKFCFKYTHVCSMNIRYIMCAVYIGFIVTAAAVTEIQKAAASKNALLGGLCNKLTVTLPILYSVAVIVLQVGMEMLLP